MKQRPLSPRVTGSMSLGHAPSGRVFKARPAAGTAPSLALKVVFLMWLVTLFDPQWLLAAHGLGILLKTPVVLYLVLIGFLVLGVPTKREWSRRWHWWMPVVAYIAIGMITVPFAVNNGLAREGLQDTLLFWIFVVSTVALVDGARYIEKLFYMYALAFLWFALWGVRTEGLIQWHPLLSNQDAFGAYMAIGVGFCSFTFAAAPKGRGRHLLLLVSALCVVGVVASFARGAFLAAAAVFFLIWIRSKRKGKTLLAGIGAVILVTLVAEIIYPGKFWAEIQSVFDEGTDSGTGEDRWVLWMAAVEVFKERPLFGVGMNNFGAFATTIFQEGDLGSRYGRNVGALYGRSLHSLYFQTLSEMGIAGVLVLGWILWAFWRRNRILRSVEADALWRQLGGRFELRSLALAIELGMVAFLCIAAVYSTAAKHWFWSLNALNLLLYTEISRAAAAAGVQLHARSPRRVGRRPISTQAGTELRKSLS